MKTRSLLVLILFLVTHVAHGEGRIGNVVPRKKVAVVLSGGGAKGMAHIGALRVIEKAGVPIDIVTGTSMGALIGGLYSVGYDAEMLDSLVKIQDWKSLLSDKIDLRAQSLSERARQSTYILSRPLSVGQRKKRASGGLIAGSNLAALFSRLTVGWHDSISFDSLPIPFACVATNIVDNSEFVFRSGRITTAMRASMAIPGVFTPVRIDSMVLVDGGLRNNYPADIARQMGADVIIGVSVQSDDRSAGELQSSQDILLQIVDQNCKNKFEENMAITDIPIKVDVKGYSSASFNHAAVASLISRGELAAMRHWDELLALGRSLVAENNGACPRRALRRPLGKNMSVRVLDVVFEGIAPYDQRFLLSKYGLADRDSVLVKSIDDAITYLSESRLYSNVGYTLTNGQGGYVLTIASGGRRTGRVNLGVRFDTEEMVALQVNMSHQTNVGTPLNLEITGRLGKRMMARIDADIMPLHYGRVGLSYIFRHDDINIYERGKRTFGFTYNRHTLHLRAFNLDFRNVSLDIGLKSDFYNFNDVLYGEGSEQKKLSNISIYGYDFRLNYDSEDKWLLPTRGAKFHVGYCYYTDNLIGWNGNAGISVVDGLWRMSFSLNSRFVLQPMVFGRLLAGNGMPLILRNAVGGQVSGHYLVQQLPFAGIGRVEFIDDMVVGLQLRAQQRMGDNNYVVGRVSVAQYDDKLKGLFRSSPMAGFEAAYYYDSMFGPLGASLGYSTHTKQVYLYVNLGFKF